MTGNRQRIGGVAALVEAATFVIGFVLAATTLADYTVEDPEPADAVDFLVENEAAVYAFNTVIFIVFGVALVVLTLALHDRLRADEPFLSQTAAVFGVIWATLVLAAGMIANLGLGSVVDLAGSDGASARTVWSTLDAVQDGLGGGIEIVGGLWVALVSAAALRSGSLPNGLNYLGAVVGVAGIVSVVPVPEAVLAVFGLGLIVWFLALGVVLLRTPRGATA